MRRILGITIAWIVLAIGLARAAPARPLYTPSVRPTPPTRKVFDLHNSAWLGKYNAAARTFIFEADGTLSYKVPTSKLGKSYKNRGFWRLEGNTVFFEYYINPKQKLMEFRGTMVDINTIVGEAHYLLNGSRTKQTLHREPVP
ncbi:MAG TPA: hypothetical protein VFE62_09770 [Gemmataceae bacterium]|nr:hypothetical protein [Gemmataceae bacterium]